MPRAEPAETKTAHGVTRPPDLPTRPTLCTSACQGLVLDPRCAAAPAPPPIRPAFLAVGQEPGQTLSFGLRRQKPAAENRPCGPQSAGPILRPSP